MICKANKEIIKFPTIHGHASTLLKRGDEIWMAWWGGHPEPHDDITIFFAKRVNGQWSEPMPIERVGNVMHWNPVFFDAGDHVDLHFNAGPHLYESLGYRVRTYDNGKTFTKPEELVPGSTNVRGPVRNKVITLKSGRVLAPSSQEYASGRRDCFVDISDDNGETFHMSKFVPLLRDGVTPEEGAHKPYPIALEGAIQPTLWETDDGRVSMLMRTCCGRILRSDSFDEGETWCMAYDAGLPNNNSGIDLVKLDDGRILLVCNPIPNNWGQRSPLCMFLSTDDGENFSLLFTIECVPGEYSYPAIIADGLDLYLSYTCNRTSFAFWTFTLEPRTEPLTGKNAMWWRAITMPNAIID